MLKDDKPVHIPEQACCGCLFFRLRDGGFIVSYPEIGMEYPPKSLTEAVKVELLILGTADLREGKGCESPERFVGYPVPAPLDEGMGDVIPKVVVSVVELSAPGLCQGLVEEYV